MSHFAKIGVRAAYIVDKGLQKHVGFLVDNVSVSNAEDIAADIDTNSGVWIKTSYNTQGGEHYNAGNKIKDTSPLRPALRGNYAGIDYIYDTANDVFYPQQPFPSWTISAPNWLWTAPTSMPDDGKPYQWDEVILAWVKADCP